MPYAIMRFEKRKGGPASAIEKHHERKKERYASNPDVDTDRSHLNYHLIQPQHKYYAETQGQREVHRHHRHGHAGVSGSPSAETGAPLF